MVNSQMTAYPAQSHPIYVQFQRFLAHLFIIDPRLWFRCVFDLAVHAAIALASCACFTSPVLSFGSLAFRTFVQLSMLAQFLATPKGAIRPKNLLVTPDRQ